MRTNMATTIALLALFVFGMAANLGCDSIGVGTEVLLEGVTMHMDGKLISGLPAQKADIILKVTANKISISTSGSDTVIRLIPSDATIVIGPNGVSVTGIDPSKIQIKWQDTEQAK